MKYEIYATSVGLLFESSDMLFCLVHVLDEPALTHFGEKNLKDADSYLTAKAMLSYRYSSKVEKSRLIAEFQKKHLSVDMRESPDEFQLSVIQVGSARLSALHRQLGPAFSSDAFLREQLVIYADIPQIETILRYHVPSTSQEAKQRVASRLSPFKNPAGDTVAFLSATEHTIGYNVLNRRFGDSAKKTFSNFGKIREGKKALTGCWVSKKDHFYSDQHPSQEIKAAPISERNVQSILPTVCSLLSLLWFLPLRQ